MMKKTQGIVYTAACLAVLGGLALSQPKNAEAATPTATTTTYQARVNGQQQNANGQLRLTSSYVRAAESLQTRQGQNQIDNANWCKSMLPVTRQNWQNNHYQMSQQDAQRVVDPGNLTAAQNKELNDYAMGLLNQVRR